MAVSTQKTLVGWKAIAGYFSRDERTVMRWAASRGMPVQRVAGQARSSVYAWPEDLDAWLGRSQAPARPAETPGPAVPAMPEPPAPVEPPPTSVSTPVSTSTPVRSPARRGRRIAAVAIACALLVGGLAWMALRRPEPVVPLPIPAAMPAFHDAAARGAYMQATFDWNLRTRASLLRAVAEFGDAATRDPGVAASYVGIANSYLMLREYAALPDRIAYARASAAARIAIGLDPRSMEARRSLAFIAFWGHGDVATAGRQFAEAIAIAPENPLTHHWLANALAANGEEAAALREIATARALDPTSSSTLVDDGLIAYLAGHRAEGRAMLGRLVAVLPEDASLHRDLGDIALFEGRPRDYLAEAARAADLRNDGPARRAIARQAADFARGGTALMFDRMVDAARDRTRATDEGYFELARVAAVSGRTVAAIDALAPACTKREAAAIGAPGDLWLSRAIGHGAVAGLCGRPSLEAFVSGARRAG